MKVCFECDRPAVHEHHVVPKSRGGGRTVPLCEKCHAKAHHRKRAMTTSRLTKDAMRHKKNNGERVGQIPYGHDLAADGVQLIPNAAEQSVLELVDQLREAGESMRKIAAELTRRQIPRKHGFTPWMHNTIQRILNRNRR